MTPIGYTVGRDPDGPYLHVHEDELPQRLRDELFAAISRDGINWEGIVLPMDEQIVPADTEAGDNESVDEPVEAWDFDVNHYDNMPGGGHSDEDDVDIVDEYDRPAGVSYPRPGSREGIQDVQDGYNEQDPEA